MTPRTIEGIPVLLEQPRSVPLAGGALVLHAPAKINLNLLVGPRREDGYHGLDSYVCKITLYDRIVLRPRADSEIRLTCTGADCGPSERNLAMRAARLLAAQHPAGPAGVDITLEKRIPSGAGLGGGSSDAAAVLWGLDRLWGLRIGPDRLAELAGQLGSDVPLFLGPPASRMTGRGEALAPARVAAFAAILIMPAAHCSTADVYRQFDQAPPAPAAQLPEDLLAGGPPSTWRSRLVNQLAPAARQVCPELDRLWAELSSGAIGVPVHLSGSGSALFVLCDDLEELARVAAHIPPRLRRSCVVVGPSGW